MLRESDLYTASGRKGAPMRKVTVEDVARHAGVSTATVSRAVNGSGTVAQHTYQRVMSSVNELGFTPTPAARNLRQQRTRNIALVVPSIVNPFFPEDRKSTRLNSSHVAI